MKRSLIILLVLLTTAVFGQKGFLIGAGAYYGVSGVVNQNTYGEPELDYDVPSSYGVGLNLGFRFSDHLGIRIEAGYARLGQKYFDTRTLPGDTVPANFTRDIKLDYITIPVLFKYNTNGKAARFYLLAGPQIGILMGAKQEYLANGAVYFSDATDLDGNAFQVSEPDIKNRLSSIDLMARIDLGAEFTLVSNLLLNVGITMNYGFLDLNAPAFRMLDYSGNYNGSHNFYGGITLGVSYCIPIGR